jgi:lipopolysaccharide export system permease protein
MIKLIDRQMIRGYFKAYIVCLTSLLSLYVVVDLFTNLDDFAKRNQTLLATLEHIGSYYGCQIFKIFDRLSEVIVLLAAMFTVTLMQRNNEQLPLLSAGVSTRRIVAPVLVCASLMLILSVVNQEFILPRLADYLNRDRDDMAGEKEQAVKNQYEPNGIHITGDRGQRNGPNGPTIRKMQVTIPEALAGRPYHITAAEAHFFRIEPRKYRWELKGCFPSDIESWDPSVLEVKDTGRYILYTHEVDFDSLTRNPNWYLLAPTSRLYEELRKPDISRLGQLAVQFQMRLTRPILGLLLVFMGVSMILRDQNRNVIISAGSCLVLCGIFFAVCYACKMLGDSDILSPVFSAWAPVVLFGPFAFVLFDAVHT